jgi:hypothetical protein
MSTLHATPATATAKQTQPVPVAPMQTQGGPQQSAAALKVQSAPGEHYEGYIQHPFYGSKELKLLITRPANDPQQVVAWCEGLDIQRNFGKDGLIDLCDEVDRNKEVNGNVVLMGVDKTSVPGKLYLAKHKQHAAAAPDPLSLALLNFGAENKSSLEHHPDWQTWATKQGIAKEKMKPISTDNMLWYWMPNNWYHLIDTMKMNKQDIVTAHDGRLVASWVDVPPHFDEKVANWLHSATGGSIGMPWDQELHKREESVPNLYEDKAFGSPKDCNRFWHIPGDPDADDHDLPATWENTYDSNAGRPYALPVGGGIERAHQPMLGKIYQGALEDFYFVQACVTLQMKSKLVADLFVNDDLSAPHSDMHQLRFYKCGQWVPVTVDTYLPYNKDDEPMCCHSEDFPGITWPSLAEKAYAKLHGSWCSLSDKGGDVEEVLVDMTGGCCGRFNSTDVANDRMWSYFSQSKETCIWGCIIDNAECSKRNIPIAQHWASAIFDTRMHKGVPCVGVFTCAPFSSVKHFPLVDIPDHDFHNGFMWLRIEDFAQLFREVFECRLVNSDLFPYMPPAETLREPVQRSIAPPPPGRPDSRAFPNGVLYGVKGGPWHENVCGFRGDADMTKEPSFLMMIQGETEVILAVDQECSRYEAGQMGKERRSDPQHGIFKVTYEEYVKAMQQRSNGQKEVPSRGQINDHWETMAVDKSDEQLKGSDGSGSGFWVREPMAPLLIRFYQCSHDMEFRYGNPFGQSYVPVAEVNDGEFHLVHTSSWAHCRGAFCAVKVKGTGAYMASIAMPPQYSCRHLCFRTYSNKPIQIANFTWPRNVIVSNPAFALGAIPYSLTGFPRIDSADDRLPAMFDEDRGCGEKHSGPPWMRRYQERLEKAQESGGPKAIGEFGGHDAIATQAAKETQSIGFGHH